MSKKKHTPGAFGGLYRHEVIRQLRAQLAQSNLIVAALIDHTKIGEAELKKVCADFITRQERAIREGKNQ